MFPNGLPAMLVPGSAHRPGVLPGLRPAHPAGRGGRDRGPGARQRAATLRQPLAALWRFEIPSGYGKSQFPIGKSSINGEPIVSLP